MTIIEILFRQNLNCYNTRFTYGAGHFDAAAGYFDVAELSLSLNWESK